MDFFLNAVGGILGNAFGCKRSTPIPQERAFETNFFDLPIELRLQIYSELLVLPEPAIFTIIHYPPPPFLVKWQMKGLYPALLRTNKRVYSEASALLYSSNRFQFPEIHTTETKHNPYIAPFLDQIGPQASRIHHICFNFPDFDRRPEIKLSEENIKTIELIRDTCTSIRVIELIFMKYAAMYFDPPVKEEFDVLYTHLETIPSLKEVVVNFEVCPIRQPRDDLLKLVRSYGWTVQITTPEDPNDFMVDEYGRSLFKDEDSKDEDSKGEDSEDEDSLDDDSLDEEDEDEDEDNEDGVNEDGDEDEDEDEDEEG